MLGTRFIGTVYVNGKHFTHPNRLMGAAETTRNKTLKELRQNVREALTRHFISTNDIEFHVCDRQTKQVEIVKY